MYAFESAIGVNTKNDMTLLTEITHAFLQEMSYYLFLELREKLLFYSNICPWQYQLSSISHQALCTSIYLTVIYN